MGTDTRSVSSAAISSSRCCNHDRIASLWDVSRDMEEDARDSFRVRQAPYWCDRTLPAIGLDNPDLAPEF